MSPGVRGGLVGDLRRVFERERVVTLPSETHA